MSIRLFILGTLASGNYHPYMIKKKLAEAIPDEILFHVSEGKLYYNFEALHKKGYIREYEVIHESNRPDKTLYAITDTGRKALEQAIYDAFKEASNVSDLYIPIYFLKYVNTNKVAYILEEVIQKEKERWKSYSDVSDDVKLKLKKEDEKAEKSTDFIIKHSFSKANMNLEWLEKLLLFVKDY